MKELGGYLQLELNGNEEHHKTALPLNTGRNALELILRVRKYTKVYIPYYTCDVILEPFRKLNIEYEFYSINKDLEPSFNYPLLRDNEGFLYVNYFGIKDNYIPRLAEDCKNIIIDNSQAFFCRNLKDIDTFYSCRKFFGVPDGAYLYLSELGSVDLPIDTSLDRLGHLIKRIECGASAGYKDFKENERKLINQPIKRMSRLTSALLRNIDYEKTKEIRNDNFFRLHDRLMGYNELIISVGKESVPMVYPFLSRIPDLKQILINRNIFVAQYWPNVNDWQMNKDSIDILYSNNLCALPINQNLSKDDIIYISRQVLKIIKDSR